MLNVLPRYAPLNVPYRVNGYAVLRGNISSRSRIRANGSYVVRGEFGKTGFLATNLTPFSVAVGVIDCNCADEQVRRVDACRRIAGVAHQPIKLQRQAMVERVCRTMCKQVHAFLVLTKSKTPIAVVIQRSIPNYTAVRLLLRALRKAEAEARHCAIRFANMRQSRAIKPLLFHAQNLGRAKIINNG